MEVFQRILTKEEINRRFITAVNAIMANNLISSKSGLAESLGVKPAKFSEILNGRMKVGIDMIAILCDFYHISPEWLLMSRGNNVFRPSSTLAKIWVDDEDLDVHIPDENEANQYLSTQQSSSDSTANALLSIIRDKDEAIRKQAEDIGRLKEQILQLECKKGEKTLGQASSRQITDTFPSAHSAASPGTIRKTTK